MTLLHGPNDVVTMFSEGYYVGTEDKRRRALLV